MLGAQAVQRLVQVEDATDHLAERLVMFGVANGPERRRQTPEAGIREEGVGGDLRLLDHGVLQKPMNQNDVWSHQILPAAEFLHDEGAQAK